MQEGTFGSLLDSYGFMVYHSGEMSGKTFNLTLEAMDGRPLSERTGKSKVKGISTMLPSPPPLYFCVFYNEGEAVHPKNPSPGLAIATAIVENIGNEYRITDVEGRVFRIIMEEPNG